MTAYPMSFAWVDGSTPEARALALVRSMAAVKCRNMYPVGVIGREARAHYDEARRIAQGVQLREDARSVAEAEGLQPGGEAMRPDVVEGKAERFEEGREG